MFAVGPRVAVWLLVVCLLPASAQQQGAPGAVLVEKENIVEAQKRNTPWKVAERGLGLEVRDRLRTGEFSRAALRFLDASMRESMS